MGSSPVTITPDAPMAGVTITPDSQPGTGFLSGLGAGASYLGKQLASPIMHPLDTLNSAMSMASGAMPIQAAKGAYDQYKAARASGSPPVSSAAEAIGQTGGLPAQEIRERAQRGDVSGIAGEALPSIIATLLGGRTAEKGLPDVGGGVRETIGKYSGISDLQSKIAQRGQLAADAVNSAKTAEEAAHKVASAPYDELKNHPAIKQQALEPSEFKAGAQDIVDSTVKGGKIPAAINEILDTGAAKGSTVRALTNSEMQMADVIKKTVLDKGGTIKQARETAANYGYAPRQIDAMMSIMGESGSEGIGFEQLKQMKSNLGRAMGSYDGPAEAAAGKLYKYLDENLRGIVDKASELPGGKGLLEKYADAREGYKEFMDDWHNGHPIEKLLNGQDTNKIIDSFRGDTGKRVTNTLNKYGADATPFQGLHKAGLIDEPFKNAEADSGVLSEKDLAKARLKDISKQGVTRGLKSPWTVGGLAVGAVNPAVMPLAIAHAGLRLGLPKLLGSDFMGNWLTKGMSEDLPKIPPKKVLPKPPVKE